MLTEMDGIEGRKGVYIMAATNRREILDPAITRPGRLETILYVGLPENQDRVAILNALTKKKTRPDFASDVSFEKLSENCEGYSGADLRALVTKASEMAFSESILKSCDLKVNMKHFTHAMTSMRQSVEGKEKKRYEKMRQKIMVNESQNQGQVQVDQSNESKVESDDEEMIEKSDDVEMTEKSMMSDVISATEISKTVIDAAIEASVTEITNESTKTEAENSVGPKSVDSKGEEKVEETHTEKVDEAIIEKPSETKVVSNGDKIEEKYSRYLPSMKVGVKGSGLLSQVIKSLEDNKVLIYGKDKSEISIHVKELEPYTPNPGDKAKSLNKDVPDDTVFKVIQYDSDDDESMVVENVEDKEESTLKIDTLCVLMEQ